MAGLREHLILLFCFTFLVGCSTVPDKRVSLNDALNDARVLNLPFPDQKNGLIILNDVLIGDKKLKLLVDTGATRSAIFERHISGLNLEDSPRRVVNVYGIAGVAQREVVQIPKLVIGPKEVDNVDFVILPNREKQSVFRSRDVEMDGLIGMDILSEYSLYISRKSSTLTLVPKDMNLRTPRSWSHIELIPNPFIEDDKGLHFFSLDIWDDDVTTLLDTGAEINVMNWNDVRPPRLRSWYRRMRDDWDIQGAVGSFDPKLRVNMGTVKSANVIWSDKNFIVMDVPSLDILGVGESAFIVAGFTLLDHEELFIDFERNFLSVKTKRNSNAYETLRVLSNAQ